MSSTPAWVMANLPTDYKKLIEELKSIADGTYLNVEETSRIAALVIEKLTAQREIIGYQHVGDEQFNNATGDVDWDLLQGADGSIIAFNRTEGDEAYGGFKSIEEARGYLTVQNQERIHGW